MKIIRWIWSFIIKHFNREDSQHIEIKQKAAGKNITQIGIQNNKKQA